jgi:hypothetical protein
MPNKYAMPYFNGSTVGYISIDMWMAVDKLARHGIRMAKDEIDDYAKLCMNQLVEMESLLRADQQKYGIDGNMYDSKAATIAMKRAFLNNTISKNFNELLMLWYVNIHTLLLLKRIQNDEMNGWLIVDNSKKGKIIVSMDGVVNLIPNPWHSSV